MMLVLLLVLDDDFSLELRRRRERRAWFQLPKGKDVKNKNGQLISITEEKKTAGRQIPTS